MSGEEEYVEREINHWIHPHPLALHEVTENELYMCHVCGRKGSIGEQGYTCSINCGYDFGFFHEECARFPRKIRHSLHSDDQHILMAGIHDYSWSVECAICECYVFKNGYVCTSLQCKFGMHVKCAYGSGMIEAVDEEEEKRGSTLHHQSHPKHELMRLSGKSSFKCDACGTTRIDTSYTCTACRYWIHETCASLPETIKREDHSHSLSLSFHVPHEYIYFEYKCEVCEKYVNIKHWIYHCKLCRYIVHIECAFKKIKPIMNIGNDKAIIRFPMHEDVDVGEELIRPFVIRQGRAISRGDEMVNTGVEEYEFPPHKHKLTLVSSPPLDDQNKDTEEEDDDSDYKEDDGNRGAGIIICDGCISPIVNEKKKEYCHYMSCTKCKYNLHLACFHLPPHILSLPIIHDDISHDLLLQTPKLNCYRYCLVCYRPSSGLFYACTTCIFQADIKCASMPNTIYHEAHPKHHPLKLINAWYSLKVKSAQCFADCGESTGNKICYTCDDCDFIIHLGCAMLPASTTSRRWDKHHPRLPLTYDANVNHPDEFYCDECETRMNPKSWMYHCRLCDISFHPRCFPATTGKYRNIKFGRKFENAAVHPHSLTYQLLTTNGRCNVCHEDMYNERGYHCASCNFFICAVYCNPDLNSIIT